MRDIICECGHLAKYHSNLLYHNGNTHKTNKALCGCELDYQGVLVSAIARLEADKARLVEALRNMTQEFKMDDHNLTFPSCNCISHKQYSSARALLAEMEQS